VTHLQYRLVAVLAVSVAYVSLAVHRSHAQEPATRPAVQIKPNPPAVDVRGSVSKVDAREGLAEISLGKDHGLEVGHTLEVFRLKPNPTYLGMMRLVAVEKQRSVGKLVRPTPGAVLQVGDQVASRLLDSPKEQPAADNDLLKAQRDRVVVEEQKLKQVVEANVEKARRLYPFDAPQALQLLRAAVLQVWDHLDITEQHREALLAQLVAARRKLTQGK
jgi:hypothetical protein